MTRERYKVATVFVDHYSNLGYTHYQTNMSVEETLKAKNAFERYASSRGVVVKHYHADNGVFAATRWVDDCYTKGQGITFAATNAHHQNGKAEIRIRHLQDMASVKIHRRAFQSLWIEL